MRAPCNLRWIKSTFPRRAAGGLPGSHGPEELSAVVAHQLASMGHGVSLDLTHAFDTVNLNMMEKVMKDLLPKVCLGGVVSSLINGNL